MKIKILENPNPPKFVNTYVVRTIFISGNADSFETVECAGSRDQIEPLLTFLLALDKKSKDNDKFKRLEEDSWNNLPCAYVVEHYSGQIPKEAEDKDFTLIEWPGDVTTPDYLAYLGEWKLYWYENGQEYECEIIEE